MEDSMSQRVYLVTAVLTLVTFTAFDAVIARLCNATLWTGRRIGVDLLKYIVQTGIVIWEAFVEVFNRELHTTSVLQRLHVVKG